MAVGRSSKAKIIFCSLVALYLIYILLIATARVQKSSFDIPTYFKSLSKRRYASYVRRRAKAFGGSKSLYYSNTTADTHFSLLKLSGNVELNPGLVSTQLKQSSTTDKCKSCDKAVKRNQNVVHCSSCFGVFHKKCTALDIRDLKRLEVDVATTWQYGGCVFPYFSDSFFVDEINWS